jgi:hypothetical protein
MFSFKFDGSSSGFGSSFLSYFKSRPPMDNQAAIILNDNSASQTGMFLLALRGWGTEFCQSNTLTDFLSEIQVTCVMHNKMPNSPEHEFLIIETQDRVGKKKALILERTVGLQRETGDINEIFSPGEALILERTVGLQRETRDINDIFSPGEGLKSLFRKIKKIASETLASGTQLGSMEEGSVRQTLSIMDKVSMSSIQSADLLSESLKLIDDLHDSPAIDQFLGENYVFSANWHGQNIRHFKPKNPISLFQLAILADVVSKTYPKYTVFKEQCYFFSGLIYSALEYEFHIESSSSTKLNTDQDHMDQGPVDQGAAVDLVVIDDSRLSNRFGHYKKHMVTKVVHEDVLDIVGKFRHAYGIEIGKVSFLIFQIISILTITFFIDHESRTIFNNYDHLNHDYEDNHNHQGTKGKT